MFQFSPFNDFQGLTGCLKNGVRSTLNKDARHALLSLGYGEHAGKATPIFVASVDP